jgi:tripartite-type tricarboxylate transporter receptor subunit TctC
LRRLACFALATVALGVLPPIARSDDAAYPSHPIRVIVPWPAGGVADSGTRRVAAIMEKTLGTRMIVDNRPGASGQIATEYVAKAAPDGYTILSGDIATHALNACVFASLRAHPLNDFEPITLRNRGPMLLVVNAASQIKSLDDLVKRSLAEPDGLPYASPGLGTLQHLHTERLIQATGAKLRPVLFKGEAPGILDVAGGQLPVMMTFPSVALPHIQSGKLRAIAVTAKKRVPALPDTPTFNELGRPELETYGWGAFFAPKGTPRPILDKLSAAMAKASEDASLRAFTATFGAEPAHSTPDETRAWVRSEIDRLCAITKRLGIRLEP